MANQQFEEKVMSYLAQLAEDMTCLRQDIKELERRVQKIELQLENEISPKISVLHDGYVQHTDQLERIEDKVSRHEEFTFSIKGNLFFSE
ncbi:MAG TPA: hypothetical protein GX532_01510 [Clostridia bacterium]|jgi:phage shock protein A|nr:hypothetical protein [Clostridia bacterium]HHY05642.1 hypothetical protein [Clostridia bacterium]